MSVEIHVPTLGESIVDATVASWLKQEGDAVQRGDALVELETDKINVEVNAEQDGVLQQIVKQAGEVVEVGAVLGIIGAEGGAKSAAVEQSKAAQPEVKSVPVAEQATVLFDAQRPPSPLARRIAAEHNVDIAQVKGSSPHGRVTKDDVINYLEQSTSVQPNAQPASSAQQVPATQPLVQPTRPAVAPPANGTKPLVEPPSANVNAGREERIRMSRRRQTIAQRLVEAQRTAAMLTTFNEVDMSAIMDVRSRRKDSFKERNNVSLGFMSFFTKAAVGALKAFPRLNAEIQGNEIVLKHYYDLGIAVSTEEGLVVPVLRDADRKSFAQIEREIADLAKRARANTLSLPELQGGTFTITNGGVFGSLLSTPILNAPQVAILGMHKIEQRPIALNGQVVIRPMMYLAMSYDHRIVDGSEAVRFLVKIKELIEDPEALLLEG
ncbi:2-oxoglutarate dehydrogenase complex dihydrolipoyllysine-residue succinyltransferase [Tengunoibacter tsumagoiensis]|uniref:Dihydrolipoyllysine-residue succinyltransferase component of 2-oxoglutarate dehydrogenase complex n=1 Tax=Tengunoibacter tsumagoiensis TaxID=2014871 RepID=A0A402A0T9_9CHLR|nr:2-oxoglutarate dehydrogenase complex dihydrolipoyllysine-residue succinyltransferase [Tengunoibacter tsumagoiensis]GCE12733.1 dihydrolipoyllysine-residue succinyltransferase component of 2-oxoglutarate dehydrogenase complex [Tengunoibacter tsumagoiensis]